MLPVLSRGVGGPGIVAQHVGRLDADNALRQKNPHGVVCAPSMTILLCSPRGHPCRDDLAPFAVREESNLYFFVFPFPTFNIRGKRRGDDQVERPEADQGMIRRWSLLGRALHVLSLLLSGASGFVPPSSVLRASPSCHALAVMSFDGAERASALAFCRESPTAVIATVWPTAHSQVSAARAWLDTTGCTLVHEASIYLSPQAAVPAILALYHGEEWLDSNCWYMESPLPEGPPQGPFAGAKWKAQLAFREDAPMHVFVLDAAGASRLWSSKYAIREKLRASVGSLGNSCLHLTDDQSDALNAWRQGHGVLHGGYQAHARMKRIACRHRGIWADVCCIHTGGTSVTAATPFTVLGFC